MTEKERLIKFCEDMLAYARGDNHISITRMEKHLIKDGSSGELKLIDGAMQTVGDIKIMGIAYELDIQIWDKEKKERNESTL